MLLWYLLVPMVCMPMVCMPMVCIPMVCIPMVCKLTTMTVVNPPEKKLAKRTLVHWEL